MFPSFDIFTQVFNDITEDFGCMVINNRVHSKNITDKVFWYKAKEVPKFKLGSGKYNKFHDNQYDESWNKKLPMFDPGEIRPNWPNQPPIAPCKSGMLSCFPRSSM